MLYARFSEDEQDEVWVNSDDDAPHNADDDEDIVDPEPPARYDQKRVGGLSERIAMLRELRIFLCLRLSVAGFLMQHHRKCTRDVAPEVFKRVYDLVREKNFGNQDPGTDWEAEEAAVREQVAAELGPENIHYWYWVQELIFCEETLSGLN